MRRCSQVRRWRSAGLDVSLVDAASLTCIQAINERRTKRRKKGGQNEAAKTTATQAQRLNGATLDTL